MTDTVDAQRLAWGSEAVELLPEHAVWWPAARTLLVADLHLGKAASFRAQGLPVPAGTTRENLHRLEALLARHPAERLVFLGDFLHAAQGRSPGVLEGELLVLPAFGAFTGMHPVRAQAGERLYAIADDAVVALPGG